MSPERGIFSVFSYMTSWFSDAIWAGWSGVEILAAVIDFFLSAERTVFEC